jgi:hypothetical protein
VLGDAERGRSPRGVQDGSLGELGGDQAGPRETARALLGEGAGQRPYTDVAGVEAHVDDEGPSAMGSSLAHPRTGGKVVREQRDHSGPAVERSRRITDRRSKSHAPGREYLAEGVYTPAYSTVDAHPYPWPFDGPLDPARTALLCIDWQVDFCGVGGYVDRMGYDLALTRDPVAPTAVVLEAMRRVGCTVVHTREGHRPDLSDCPPNKRWRSQRIGAGIGDAACGLDWLILNDDNCREVDHDQHSANRFGRPRPDGSLRWSRYFAALVC